MSKLGSQLQRCDTENLVPGAEDIERESSACLGRYMEDDCIKRHDKTPSDTVLTGCTLQGAR